MSATGSRAIASAGFTLLEMLVVLAIAGLIAGLGFPRLQGQVTAQEMRTGVASVTALLRRARAAAVRSGVPTNVVVAPQGNAIRIVGAAPLALPASVRVTADAPLTFYNDGSAQGGGIAVAGAGRRVRIDVAAATGLVLPPAPLPAIRVP